MKPKGFPFFFEEKFLVLVSYLTRLTLYCFDELEFDKLFLELGMILSEGSVMRCIILLLLIA